MKVHYKPEDGMRVPIKMWISDIESGAMEQAVHLASLPFTFKHVALMPDAHQGYGMPIGGVLATDDVIIPNAVGVDIGCGMCAIQTPWLTEQVGDTLKKILSRIREQIPIGFAHHKVAQDISLMPMPEMIRTSIPIASFSYVIVKREFSNALTQVGTLGGGNHFIEIQKDINNVVWVMIHSGSRNIGLQVAKYYNELAKEMNQKWHVGIPKEWDLAFLPMDSEQGRDYWIEMQYCVDFALANRKLMMARIADIFNEEMEGAGRSELQMNLSKMINIAHNYATMENHFGKNVVVHRKGATLARGKVYSIIPGSQGTKSYIVLGKENPESFHSCSHGAGRKMGRKQAQRELDLLEEQKRLDDQGILHSLRGTKDLDEAAGAYKDISEVMNNQEDLVEKVVELSPIAVIKG